MNKSLNTGEFHLGGDAQEGMAQRRYVVGLAAQALAATAARAFGPTIYGEESPAPELSQTVTPESSVASVSIAGSVDFMPDANINPN